MNIKLNKNLKVRYFCTNPKFDNQENPIARNQLIPNKIILKYYN